jgi:hypothetical protein
VTNPTTKEIAMGYVMPVVQEIIDPRNGRPASVHGAGATSQRDLVLASLLRLPAR